MKSGINTSFDSSGEEIVSLYDKVASSVAEIYERQNHIEWIQRFAKQIPKGGRILDLGCGTGKDVAIFNDLGFKASGIDGSAGMLSEAVRIHPNIKVAFGDVRKLEIPDNFFDGVWSWSVITHLKDEDKKSALKEVYRVLKSGGTFAQTIWRGRGLFVYTFHKNVLQRPHFLISVSSWQKLYKEAGFTNFNIKNIKAKKGRGSIYLTATSK